jgi:excisionase family DNA binding protein
MPCPAPPRQLESIASGAAYINVSTRTIRRWIASGQLRAYRVGPRLCKIDRADLERLVRRIPAAGGGDAA